MTGEAWTKDEVSVSKGKEIALEITDMTEDGKGVGRFGALAVFVEGGVPGDEVRARVTKCKKRYAIAQLLAILTPSADRAEPPCPYYGACGGCTMQELNEAAQARLKKEQVRNKLVRLGGMTAPLVRETIAGDAPLLRYRNKAEFAVERTASGVAVGFRRRGSSAVVDCGDCLIQKKATMAVAAAMREILREKMLSVYDPRSGKGFLRGFTVKLCEGTGKMMLVLTGTAKTFPRAEDVVMRVADAIEAAASEEEDFFLASVVLEVKKGRDVQEAASAYLPIAGTRTITDEVVFGEGEQERTLRFELSAPAFYQVNTRQMKRLYAKAEEYAALAGGETVFDLYCGIGTIGLSMAHRAGMVVGIEEVKEAVLDANRNAVINGIVNARYYTGKAETVLPRLLDESDALCATYLDREAEKVAILDPPRAGCDVRLLETVASCGAARIVYISCDPGTLSRDGKLLGELGYEFAEATPVEMFPLTGCTEVVALFRKSGERL